MCKLLYNKYYLKIIFSLIFIINIFGFINFCSGFELPHLFTILDQTASHILIQYQLQQLPSFAEIQKDINDTTSEQAAGNRQQAGNIVYRTLARIPENVEPSIEIVRVEWEKVPEETVKKQATGNRQQAEYSSKNAELITVKSGYLRNQKIAIVEVHPLKGEASNISFAMSIVFKIKLTDIRSQDSGDRKQKTENRRQKTEAGYCSGAEEAFEQILRNNILNYNSLNRNKVEIKPSAFSLQPSANLVSTSLFPLKITVKEPGIYKVTYDDIKNAGWDLSQFDPTKLQLKNMGNNIPILFYGDADHSFDSIDYFIFYGEPIKSDMGHPWAPNKFIVPNTYWLYYSPDATIERMIISKQPLIEAKTLEEFTQNYHAEIDKIITAENVLWYFWEKFPDDTDKERKDRLEKSFNISISGLNLPKGGILRIRFCGKNNAEHHFKISVNSVWSEEVYYKGINFFEFTGELPADVLKEGDNTITIRNMYDTEIENFFYLDWIEIEYQNIFKAVDDVLFFKVNSSSQYNVKIDNFSNNTIVLFDITDRYNITKIEGVELSGSGNNYSITFGEQSVGNKSYIALTTDRIKKPVSVSVDEPSDIKNTSNRADYIIITHEDFYEEIQRLAEHRRNDGYEVKVVKVQDIYDEFNYGVMHPQAIKDFLSFAFHNWHPPAPTFVLLVGDGCSDATDRLNLGNKNYIPVKILKTAMANESWYVQVSGDDILPDMIIGRIPVKTVEQLQNVINKIITYEASPVLEWMRNVQFIAGIYKEGPFADVIKRLANQLPFNYYIDFLTPHDFEQTDTAYLKIIDKINAGKALTLYLGHSNIEEWSSMFNKKNFIDLKNKQKPTFLITLDCRNGNFCNPFAEGFSEEFLRNQAGGLACFSHDNWGYVSEHEKIGGNLLEIIFTDKNNLLGSASIQAVTKAYLDNAIDEDTFSTYIFMGDPATKFKICEFNLESPADAASVSSNARFTWVADGYTRFNIQFSPYPDFSKFPTLSYYTTEPSFAPNPLVSARLNLMAKTHGTIYWRVGGSEKHR